MVDVWLMVTIGLGILLGTIFTRVFDWLLQAVAKKQ